MQRTAQLTSITLSPNHTIHKDYSAIKCCSSPNHFNFPSIAQVPKRLFEPIQSVVLCFVLYILNITTNLHLRISYKLCINKLSSCSLKHVPHTVKYSHTLRCKFRLLLNQRLHMRICVTFATLRNLLAIQLQNQNGFLFLHCKLYYKKY